MMHKELRLIQLSLFCCPRHLGRGLTIRQLLYCRAYFNMLVPETGTSMIALCFSVYAIVSVYQHALLSIEILSSMYFNYSRVLTDISPILNEFIIRMTMKNKK